MRTLKLSQGPNDSAHGQPHDIVEIAFDAADTDYADPLLDGIGARFVKRMIAVDIAFDLGGGQVVEPDGGGVGETVFAGSLQHRYTGDDFVPFSGKAGENMDRVGAVAGLTDNIIRQDNDGVGGDDQSFFADGLLNRKRFVAGDVDGHFG